MKLNPSTSQQARATASAIYGEKSHTNDDEHPTVIIITITIIVITSNSNSAQTVQQDLAIIIALPGTYASHVNTTAGRTLTVAALEDGVEIFLGHT